MNGRAADIKKLKKICKKKKIFLVEDSAQAVGVKKTNKYLEDMVDELTDYKNAIIEIKLSQERRLHELIKYLESSLDEAGLNELQVRKLNKERDNIEMKLKQIRQELKDLEI